jgi:hypothetical protein
MRRGKTTNYVIDMWPVASRLWSMEVYIRIREFAYLFVLGSGSDSERVVQLAVVFTAQRRESSLFLER